jgi:DNA-binding PadR family transcriptional regulator
MPKANTETLGAVSEINVDKFLPLTTLAFEVMLAVAESQLHGYEIMTAVEQRTDGVLSPNPGTLYRLIDRLATQGLLETVEAAVGRHLETRRFYRLSKLGTRVIEAEARRLESQVKAARARRVLKRV